MERTALARAALAFAGLLVLWRIIGVNAALYDDNGRPLLAAGSDSSALVEVLRHNPAEIAALLLLGQERERTGDAPAAARAYQAAGAIAPIDRDALALSSGFYLRQGRTAEAVAQLDRLVENYGEYDSVFPVFAQLLAARDPAVAAIAARNPAWLGAFIRDGCRRAIDPGLLAPLLQLRAARAQPPEVECVCERLRSAGRWDEAYQVWLNSLPRERLAEVGYVFNGSFEFPASGVGFDWRLGQGPERDLGHTAMFAPSTSGAGARALRVTYNGKRQAGAAIEQFVAAPPGRYQVTGLARIDKLSSVRGVNWVMRCASEAAAPTLGASERFLGAADWHRFDFTVNIPPGCAAQVLRLEPVGMNEGTTYLAGTAWFDDLRLAHAR